MHILQQRAFQSVIRNALKLAQLQLSINTEFIPLMHIVEKSKSISSKNINYETFICTKEQPVLEMCWSQPVSSRGQNLASKTKQPFYRGTRRKCCIILRKQLSYHRISVKTMNVSGSVSQEHVNFCSSICVFCGLCFKTKCNE